MSDHHARYEDLIARFVEWASDRPDVQGAIIVGSRARTDRPADEWSDLDAVIFADNPDTLLQDGDWVSRLGEWDISFLEPTAVGIWEERRVLFANGCDADFSILPATLVDDLEQRGAESVLHVQASNVLARGYRVLVNRDGRLAPLLRQMASTATPPDERPSQGELDQVLSDFWYHCPWIARKLRRGELAVAHECLEGNQRRLLLQLTRWLTARDADTWHGTRYFEEWAPADLKAPYALTFAHYDAIDIARALGAMMDLVSLVGKEVGDVYGLDVDSRAEAGGRRWTATILAQ